MKQTSDQKTKNRVVNSLRGKVDFICHFVWHFVWHKFYRTVNSIMLCMLSIFNQTAIAQDEGPIFGVQRWDMYSGKGATQQQELGYLPGKQGFLIPEEWHHRAPFFARRTTDVDWITHPDDAGPLWFNHPYDEDVLQAAMDKEIDFATDAGIDFFIFNGPARTVNKKAYELHNNLDAYLRNTRTDKTKFVTALYGHGTLKYSRSMVDLMLDEVIAYMQLPQWQTVLDGRPLLPVLWPIKFKDHLASEDLAADEQMTLAEFVQHIRTRVMAVGLQDPYLVGQEVSKTHQNGAEIAAAGFDALSEYAGGYGGTTSTRDNAPTYNHATDVMMQTWVDKYLNSGIDVDYVPAMSIGAYAWPRAHSDTLYHYLLPNAGDITSRVEKTFAFVEANKAQIPAEVVFSYSWNEHSEMVAINPTMGDSPDYVPNTRWIDEVQAGLPAKADGPTELPVNVITIADDTPVTDNIAATVTLSPIVTSVDNNVTLSHYWTINEVVLPDSNNAILTIAESDHNPGADLVVELTVSDSVITTKRTWNITINNLPTAELAVVVTEGEQAVFTLTDGDAENDALAIQWQVAGISIPESNNVTSYTLNYADYMPASSVDVIVTVTDVNRPSHSITDNITVEIPDNIITIADTTPVIDNASATVTISPNIISAYNFATLSYVWTINGEMTGSDSAILTIKEDEHSPGTELTVELTVSDSVITTKRSWNITINNLPTAALAVIVTEGEQAVFSLTTGDAEDDALTIQWQVAGVVIAESDGATSYTLNYADYAPNAASIDVTVTVSDVNRATHTDSATKTVVIPATEQPSPPDNDGSSGDTAGGSSGGSIYGWLLALGITRLFMRFLPRR